MCAMVHSEVACRVSSKYWGGGGKGKKTLPKCVSFSPWMTIQNNTKRVTKNRTVFGSFHWFWIASKLASRFKSISRSGSRWSNSSYFTPNIAPEFTLERLKPKSFLLVGNGGQFPHWVCFAAWPTEDCFLGLACIQLFKTLVYHMRTGGGVGA